MFSNRKMEKTFNNQARLVREYGARQAERIRRRLDELAAVDTLEDLRCLRQARCHELKGDRAGQLSVDLVDPYRLLFVPANEPIPRKHDGGLDWSWVTAVQIVGVEDTHG